MKVIRFTMRDGSAWEVPAHYIAQHRAKYFTDFPSASDDDAPPYTYEEVYRQTLENDAMLIGWASYNVQWEDIRDLATPVYMHPKGDTADWVYSPKRVVRKEEDQHEC